MASMSKQAMREESERLVREALKRKSVAVTQGKTRIETKCGKCGAPNRVSAAPGRRASSSPARNAGRSRRRCELGR
jgi:hypothetical protein